MHVRLLIALLRKQRLLASCQLTLCQRVLVLTLWPCCWRWCCVTAYAACVCRYGFGAAFEAIAGPGMHIN
jgi:hypothetical protein